jgi:hypothetical protein
MPVRSTSRIPGGLAPADTVDVDSLKSTVRLGFVPEDILLHPRKDVLFAVNRGMGVIAVVDFAQKKLLHYHYLDHAIGYPDLKCLEAGCFLFVPGYDGSLTVFDADSHDMVRRRMVGQRAYSLAVSGAGKVYIAAFWPGGLVYDFASDSLYASSMGFQEGRVRLDGSGTRLFSIGMTSSPADLVYYQLGTDGMPERVWSDKYHGDYPLNALQFEIPPGGGYLVSASEGALYQADSSLRFLGRLPDSIAGQNDYRFEDFAFSEAGDTVFAARGESICAYAVNPPRFLYSVATMGSPHAIAKRGNRIISLSATGYLKTSYFLETVTLDR